jgi:hypothetical protein
MNQLIFSDIEFVAKRKQTRRENFLYEMNHGTLWSPEFDSVHSVTSNSANGHEITQAHALMHN